MGSTQNDPAGAVNAVTETTTFLWKGLPPQIKPPVIGIICGSGLGGLAQYVQAQPKHELDYADIPHFPRPTGVYITFSKDQPDLNLML